MTPTPTQSLLDDLATYVRSNGIGGKTTAEDLRTFLTKLISALSGVLNTGADALAQPFRIVSTQAQRDALPVGTALNVDGISSGQRTAGMFVWVGADDALYQLHIPNFAALNALEKLAALGNNAFWVDYAENTSTGFTSIEQNAYGTHPPFETQQALNVYLLGLSGGTSVSVPAAPTILRMEDTEEGGIIEFRPNPAYLSAVDYEYRFTPTTQANQPTQRTTDWLKCTDFIIRLNNDQLAPNSVQIRVKATGGVPAGLSATNGQPFSQYFAPIMVNMPDYNPTAQTLTVTTRNDMDGHTQVYVDNNFIGYVPGPINQYNTRTFSLSLAPGEHTLTSGDNTGRYTPPARTFLV